MVVLVCRRALLWLFYNSLPILLASWIAPRALQFTSCQAQSSEELSSQVPPQSALSSRAEALLSKAQQQFQSGKTEAARMALNHFVDLLKQSPQLMSQRVHYIKRAMHMAMTLRDQEPRSFSVNFLLAETLFLGNRPEESLATLLPFKEQSNQDPDYLSLLGVCYVRTGHLQEALQTFKQAIYVTPDRPDLYFHLAGLYQAARDNRAAIEILNKALEKGISSPQIHFALGLSYFNLGNLNSAINCFQKVLTLQPSFGKAYYYMGRCSAKLGNPEKAALEYGQAISIDRTDYQSYFELSLLLVKKGQLKVGVTHLEEVIRLNPKFAEAHYQLGKIYSKQGRVSEAIQSLERAIALNPDLDGAHNELGQVYLRLGNREKARQIFDLLNARKQKRKEQFEQKVTGKKEKS